VLTTTLKRVYYYLQLKVFHMPFHVAEQHRICRNRSLNCLSTPAGLKLREFLNSRQIRAAQSSPPPADQRCDLITRRVNGCTFFAASLLVRLFLLQVVNRRHVSYDDNEMNVKTILRNILRYTLILLYNHPPTRIAKLGPSAQLMVYGINYSVARISLHRFAAIFKMPMQSPSL